MKLIEEELSIKFELMVSVPHFFDLKKQIRATIIRGKNQRTKPLIGTFENRTPEYYQNIAEAVSQLSAQSPDSVGELVFVNSYQVLAEFSKYLPDVLYKDSRNATTELVLESQKDALKVF